MMVCAGFASAQSSRLAAVEQEPSVEECSPTYEAKGGLCGHALADMALIEAGADPKGITLELPSETDVTHCLLDFEVRTTTSPKSIAGSVTLEVTSLTSGLTQMTLDLNSSMTVDEVAVDGVTATYTRPTAQVVVNLGRTLAAGQAFQVRVTYHGAPRNRSDGFTFDFFDTQTNGTDLIAASFSQPFYANYWWPCKENKVNNDDKFTLDMHVTVPDTMTVASNGALAGVDTVSGGRLKFRWHESHPIATYLVSFAATRYTKIVDYFHHAGGSMPVEFYIYPDQVSVSQPYLPTVVEAITTFSEAGLYGLYPFADEKYGIAQFQWCCGMEHQTLTSQGAFTSENRNVHELAHQWWGDNITCRTWHDIWLNEGFARFSEALFKEKRPGGSYASYLAHLNANRPSTSGTGTVYRYDISSTSAIFSTAYSYNKGAWCVHMLRHVMGDEAFFDALTAYRNQYNGTAATTDEFRAVCESTWGGDLGWFFNQWVYNAGAPYYRYGWEPVQILGQNWVRLHIEQYQKTVQSSFPNAMPMPIEITVNAGALSRTQRIWNDATGTGDTVTEWFLLSADGPATSVQFDANTRILRGAATNVTYVAGPPKLVFTFPTIGSSAPPFPGVYSVQLQFSDPVTATAADFSVTGSRSGSRWFTFSQDGAGTSVWLSFGKPLQNGQSWTVEVSDAVASQAAGLMLDGEMSNPASSASLPSGDGLPGGGTTLVFNIEAFGPDLDADNDVDGDDLALLRNCMTGDGVAVVLPTCLQADLDHDNDVDQSDFGIQQQCLQGADVVPDPACAQ